MLGLGFNKGVGFKGLGFRVLVVESLVFTSDSNYLQPSRNYP